MKFTKIQQSLFTPPEDRSRRSRKVVVVVLAIGFLFGLYQLLSRFTFWGGAPQIVLSGKNTGEAVQAGSYLGKDVGMKIEATNGKSGICEIQAQLSQGEKKISILSVGQVPVIEGKSLFSGEMKADLPAGGLTEGDATLSLVAKDCSVWHIKTKIELPVKLDFGPPTLAVTSSQHYINQGGADLITYTASADAITSGVRVGPYDFRGFKNPSGGPNDHFAFFVFSYELPADAKIEVYARDAAGNESRASMAPARFFPKEFRRRDLPIDDKFIETKVTEIIANTPSLTNQGDNLKNFLLVNRELRKANNELIKKISEKTDEIFYWKDAFKPLNNAAVEANFADYRSYMYNMEKVDEQVHLGFDLAITERAPVLAGGRGKVVFADYHGIYGNMVLIDHGYGLMTLYGHLSGMDVKVGDMVEREQKIGNSGVTGLAGGDHLHFSMLIQGVQTNPVEFWDQHWIDDHVHLRLDKNLFGK